LVAMSAAAIRVASAPEPGAVRSVATLAALLFVAAAALGTYVVVASYKAFDGGTPGVDAAMALMKYELAAGMAAMIAIALVLDAARRIAVQYGELETAQRAVGLLVALVVVISGQALLQYKPFLMKHVSDPGTMVFFLLAAAVVVLIAVLKTGALARDLCGVIERGAPPARAVARVVDPG
ncbi:MAG TPA: hypothetical protein VMZ28_08805, partial [Kofleriaceae bacterium]|nr:hypothetical protein [Kofleriaceae bacterium]